MIYFTYWNSAKIGVISNGILTNYTTKCSCQSPALTIDSYGYIAQACNCSNTLFLYDQNLQYTNNCIVENTALNYGGIDTNGRLAISQVTNVVIYY